jgi:hypothetical protein
MGPLCDTGTGPKVVAAVCPIPTSYHADKVILIQATPPLTTFPTALTPDTPCPGAHPLELLCNPWLQQVWICMEGCGEQQEARCLGSEGGLTNASLAHQHLHTAQQRSCAVCVPSTLRCLRCVLGCMFLSTSGSPLVGFLHMDVLSWRAMKLWSWRTWLDEHTPPPEVRLRMPPLPTNTYPQHMAAPGQTHMSLMPIQHAAAKGSRQSECLDNMKDSAGCNCLLSQLLQRCCVAGVLSLLQPPLLGS